MKKIALVFILAVFVPSLALAWLAVRSLRDQQLILERQQSLLAQDQADALARGVEDFLAEQQVKFAKTVESLMEGRDAAQAAKFDEQIRGIWPPAEVGFVVTLGGSMLCPSPAGGLAAKTFLTENGNFVRNVQGAEVYWASKEASGATDDSGAQSLSQMPAGNANFSKNKLSQTKRIVVPTQQAQIESKMDSEALSKVASTCVEFKELVGVGADGRVARYVDNKLELLIWHRLGRDPNLIFGAQLSVPRMKELLAPLVRRMEPPLQGEFVAALLDDTAKPAAISRDGFRTGWKRPFAATELGEALPHWEMAVYLLDPARLAHSARVLECTLGLLIFGSLIAIGLGGWLIVTDLRRQLALARQKTDFVGNVSHELKTPLTSIRMFSELLASGRVSAPEKQRDYLNIISVEAGRLTRLINNVLDFSRMDRGERNYNFQTCDLAAIVREAAETFRPHLEAGGFQIRLEAPESPLLVRGDRDALAQVMVNLLSNAEKYSPDTRDIEIRVSAAAGRPGFAEVHVLDRGRGVPRGFEEKIFEQFFRVDDSLASAVPGSGLGLTLARQIARAHGGDVVFQAREGGGSCFIFRVPADVGSA